MQETMNSTVDSMPSVLSEDASFETEFQKVFRLFDRDGSGQLDSQEFASLLKESGRDPADTDRFISEVDPSGNGKLSYEEFASIMQRGARKPRKAAVNADPNEVLVPEFLKVLDVHKKRCEAEGDYVAANLVKKRYTTLRDREERRLHEAIASRQTAEKTGVDEAHMMEAMEFNSAWSQNMSEFERQAREIEEQMKERHAVEFQKFQAQLRSEPQKTCKFSRELLNLRSIQGTLAKQGSYAEAQKVKQKGDEMEKWETMKMENELQRVYATKELKFRQRQQQELQALQKRIQRGREEHRQHWQIGAQRLMQSHRNMTNDLKNRQNIENIKAVVHVKSSLSPTKQRKPRTALTASGRKLDFVEGNRPSKGTMH